MVAVEMTKEQIESLTASATIIQKPAEIEIKPEKKERMKGWKKNKQNRWYRISK